VKDRRQGGRRVVGGGGQPVNGHRRGTAGHGRTANGPGAPRDGRTVARRGGTVPRGSRRPNGRPLPATVRPAGPGRHRGRGPRGPVGDGPTVRWRAGHRRGVAGRHGRTARRRPWSVHGGHRPDHGTRTVRPRKPNGPTTIGGSGPGVGTDGPTVPGRRAVAVSVGASSQFRQRSSRRSDRPAVLRPAGPRPVGGLRVRGPTVPGPVRPRAGGRSRRAADGPTVSGRGRTVRAGRSTECPLRGRPVRSDRFAVAPVVSGRSVPPVLPGRAGRFGPTVPPTGRGRRGVAAFLRRPVRSDLSGAGSGVRFSRCGERGPTVRTWGAGAVFRVRGRGSAVRVRGTRRGSPGEGNTERCSGSCCCPGRGKDLFRDDGVARVRVLLRPRPGPSVR